MEYKETQQLKKEAQKTINIVNAIHNKGKANVIKLFERRKIIK